MLALDVEKGPQSKPPSREAVKPLPCSYKCCPQRPKSCKKHREVLAFARQRTGYTPPSEMSLDPPTHRVQAHGKSALETPG